VEPLEAAAKDPVDPTAEAAAADEVAAAAVGVAVEPGRFTAGPDSAVDAAVGVDSLL
jgi:hypothetical protein